MTSALPSPITVDLLLSGAVGIAEAITDGTDVLWAENRPNEAGRAALMRWRGGETTEITGPDVNVRTRVHEYGGGAWWAEAGRVVFSDDARGGELFVLGADGTERQLTFDGHRYADGRFSADGAAYVCVREQHHGPSADEVENDLVAVAMDGSGVRVLASGRDFYSTPRPGPDGRVAFVAWDHPNMAWDETTLGVVDTDGTVRELPGAAAESVVLPGWTRDGRLVAVTDVSEWWNLVEVDVESGARTSLLADEVEMATPGWVFGLSTWVDTPAGIVVVASTPAGDEVRFPNGYVERRHSAVGSLRAHGDGVAYVASSFSEESAVWVHDGAQATRISEPRDLGLGAAWMPEPEHLTFPVDDSGAVAHTLFYAPANPDHAPEGKPPLLVMVHGGPTGAARRMLNLTVRFWTSRGVAVADVDYRGSTLYGRTYRHALHDGWGEIDVEDCVAAARHLASIGAVDPDRMVIAGGSAGGLTVLNALAHHDVFSGGISRYGVGDLSALAADTHKFEARYLDRLVGPWPEAEAVYTDRSPLTHVDGISAPMLVLQGAEDMIVPPNQAEAIVAALEAKNIDVTYHLFEGEGHGFRKAETIRTALAAEEAFIFGLDPSA